MFYYQIVIVTMANKLEMAMDKNRCKQCIKTVFVQFASSEIFSIGSKDHISPSILSYMASNLDHKSSVLKNTCKRKFSAI